jgi:diaminohydroxyphosphoribosylaminopyrimidine deaminase/5-amino-6-(5-phosphoribosylamino)uracil reductase
MTAETKRDEHALYMQRAIDLAQKGLGNTGLNPLVGCVIVHQQRIIGQGYHEAFGKEHAEVNAIQNVASHDLPLLKKARLYVTLEPCCHFGKTPPCTDLILQYGIPEVIIAQKDPFPKVAGKGIGQLERHGVRVLVGVLEKEATFMNRRFTTNQTNKRPYIILKWAQSADGYISGQSAERVIISGDDAQFLVHVWRSEEDAFMVGKHTFLWDKPLLTNRLINGKNPLRIALIDAVEVEEHHPFIQQQDQAILIAQQHGISALSGARLLTCDSRKNPQELMNLLLSMGVSSLVVEGGSTLLQWFIQQELVDEYRVFTSKTVYLGQGLRAPSMISGKEAQHTRTELKQDFLTEIYC